MICSACLPIEKPRCHEALEGYFLFVLPIAAPELRDDLLTG
jgi:hypothetical protein